MPKATAHSLTVFLTSLLTVFILLLSLTNLNKIFTPPKPQTQVLGVAVDLVAEKKYWEDLISKNPTYRDGYVELAKLECELKEMVACRENLEKARTLDPNFTGYPSFAALSAGTPSSAGF